MDSLHCAMLVSFILGIFCGIGLHMMITGNPKEQR
jgi:hypothetical protein